MIEKLKIFNWYLRRRYLSYLSQDNYEFYIPVRAQKTAGYYGPKETFSFGEKVYKPATKPVKYQEFDRIIFQLQQYYLSNQVFSSLIPTEFTAVMDDGNYSFIHTNINDVIEKKDVVQHTINLTPNKGKRAMAVNRFNRQRFLRGRGRLFNLKVTK
ncbi:MAG: glycosyltransferase, partial [Mucilaginibacter sp.]|nr:glycosyltransferase [Mucilaginibacter sp.]